MNTWRTVLLDFSFVLSIFKSFILPKKSYDIDFEQELEKDGHFSVGNKLHV